MLIFGKKNLLFRTPQSRNSTTLPTLLGTLSKMQAKKEAVVLAYFVRHWLLFFGKRYSLQTEQYQSKWGQV
jgi:hypothetical protein